jgi:uncharacterized protein (TIGR02453 family)
MGPHAKIISKEQTPVFSGFPPEAITFFRGLKRNNRREWFQPRKHIFENQVKAPMVELVDALNMHLLEFAREHVNDPKKAIYRFYRDTRFSADKSPYKDHIAAIFPRRGHEKHVSAGFYVGVSHEGVEVAGGIYMPGSEQLLAIRSWLAEHHEDFRKTARGPEKLMGKLQGDSLHRVPKGFSADHPAAELLKMKQWLYYTVLDVSLATSPKLLPEINKRFRAMAPVVEMLNTPLKKARSQAGFL